MKRVSRRAFYLPRPVLIGGAYLCVLILMVELAGYLPYIISAERYGPAKSVLLSAYWSNLCLMAWLLLGALLAVMYCVLRRREKTRQSAAAPGGDSPPGGKRRRAVSATSLALSLFLAAACAIPFVLGVPMITNIRAAKEDLGCLSRGEYMSYRGSFNEVRPGNISAFAGGAPSTIFELHSQYNYRKGASSNYYFVCPADIGRKSGLTELRRAEGPAIGIGPYEVEYLPNTHVITAMRPVANARGATSGHEGGDGRDTGE